MKRFGMKVSFVVLTVVSLLAGVNIADAARNKDNFTVRFRENTLVVTSTQMEEARLYSMQGKLLQKERGNFVEFELDRGTYRLYAKVNGETVTRRVELR
jgi:hypothetical protein